MGTKPLVSIIIPVYNGEDYLSEAIESALAQTYDNIEIIVVNDGSKDETERVAIRYADKIRYFSKENGGVSTALNMGIQNMRGEYFQYLPHDDLIMPEKIQKQIDAIIDSGDLMSISWTGWSFLVQETGEVRRQIIPYEWKKRSLLETSIYPLLFSLVNTVSVLIHKNYFEQYGLFDPTLRTSQDYDMWRRTFYGRKTVLVDEDLVHYRWHSLQGTQADPEFIRNCKTMSYALRDMFTETDIDSIFGSELRYYYELSEFYSIQGWEEMRQEMIDKIREIRNRGEKVIEDSIIAETRRALGMRDTDSIVLYCAGKNAFRFSRLLNQRGVHIDCVSDGDETKHGLVINGIKCVDIREVDKQNSLVIVTKDNPAEVEEDLKKKGFRTTTFERVGSDVFRVDPLYSNL